MIGEVRRLISDRGFGFIRDSSGKDYFVHASDMESEFQDLNEGDHVQFDPEQSARGPRAKQVRLLSR